MEELKNVRIIETPKMCWVDVSNPTKVEMDYLQQRFHFHSLALEDCLSITERPKIDDYDDYLFIVLFFPIYNYKYRRIEASELYVFLGANYLVTVHRGELKPLIKFFDECMSDLELQDKYMSGLTGYLFYELLSYMFDYCFPILSKIYRDIKIIERIIFEKRPSQELTLDIMVVKRNILNYRKIIKPQRAVILALQHKEKKFLPEELEDYMGDIGDQIEKIWDMLENNLELINGAQDANETLISHQINNIMKLLTIISVIILPLTLISGIYGMNVTLPLQNHPASFFILCVIMIVIAGGMLFYFYKKKWL